MLNMTDCPKQVGMTDSFRAVIDLWETDTRAGAEALAESIPTTPGRVRKWRQRDSIPGDWWHHVAAAAKRDGKPVTLELLARLAARPLPGAELTKPVEAAA